MRRIVLTLVLLTTCALRADDDPKEVQALKRSMPKEVATFISRVVECNHWSGEEPYDPERAAEITQADRRLRCGQLDADEARLRRKYRRNRLVLERIKGAKELFL